MTRRRTTTTTTTVTTTAASRPGRRGFATPLASPVAGRRPSSRPRGSAARTLVSPSLQPCVAAVNSVCLDPELSNKCAHCSKKRKSRCLRVAVPYNARGPVLDMFAALVARGADSVPPFPLPLQLSLADP